MVGPLAVVDDVVAAGCGVYLWDIALGNRLMDMPCYEVEQVDEDSPTHLVKRQASLMYRQLGRVYISPLVRRQVSLMYGQLGRVYIS